MPFRVAQIYSQLSKLKPSCCWGKFNQKCLLEIFKWFSILLTSCDKCLISLAFSNYIGKHLPRSFLKLFLPPPPCFSSFSSSSRKILVWVGIKLSDNFEERQKQFKKHFLCWFISLGTIADKLLQHAFVKFNSSCWLSKHFNRLKLSTTITTSSWWNFSRTRIGQKSCVDNFGKSYHHFHLSFMRAELLEWLELSEKSRFIFSLTRYSFASFAAFSKFSHTHTRLSVEWHSCFCRCCLLPSRIINLFITASSHNISISLSQNAFHSRTSERRRKFEMRK